MALYLGLNPGAAQEAGKESHPAEGGRAVDRVLAENEVGTAGRHDRERFGRDPEEGIHSRPCRSPRDSNS